MESVLLDAAGRRRLPATMPGFHAGGPPRNRGRRYPPDPPSVAVMRTAGDRAEGVRLRALIVNLWRAGLRISEALALAESDLDQIRGAVLVRAGKGGRRREVGMDRWGWEQLRPWLETRPSFPVGAWLCVLHGPTAGRPWTASSAREELRAAAVHAGVRRRFAPHQLRHSHAVEMASVATAGTRFATVGLSATRSLCTRSGSGRARGLVAPLSPNEQSVAALPDCRSYDRWRLD
jgi:integrase